MSRYLDVFNLSTLRRWRSVPEDVEPGALGRAFERVIIPIYTGGEGRPWRHGEFTVTGEIGKKRSVITLREDGETLVVIGICLHSRASKPLLKTITSIPDDQGLTVPWLVIRMDQDSMPRWVEHWALEVAWSLMIHVDEVGE